MAKTDSTFLNLVDKAECLKKDDPKGSHHIVEETYVSIEVVHGIKSETLASPVLPHGSCCSEASGSKRDVTDPEVNITEAKCTAI